MADGEPVSADPDRADGVVSPLDFQTMPPNCGCAWLNAAHPFLNPD